MELSGGAVRRRVTRRQAAAVIAALWIATWLAGQAGVVVPRFIPGGSSEYGAGRGTIYYDFTVRNDGWVPMTIGGAGRAGAGLELTSVEGLLPVTLGRGEETSIRLNYRVTDCGAVTGDPWAVPLTVDRLWGGQTVDFALPSQRQLEWLDPDLPPLGVVRQGPVEWQRNLADLACALQNG
jgi:hypothetical protein